MVSNRVRVAIGKWPKVDKAVVQMVKERSVLGLSRSRRVMLPKVIAAAKRLGVKDFKYSRGYVTRLTKREPVENKPKSTSRKHTVLDFLDRWPAWIRRFRLACVEYGVVDKDGFVELWRLLALDEFALSPIAEMKQALQLVLKGAEMVQSQDLLTTRSPDYRLCSVAFWAPLLGFTDGCMCTCRKRF